jgi:ketosteroid isomerase-like protein
MDTAVVQEIQQLSRAWNAAWLENDSATVDRLMAPEYVYVAPNGRILDRAAILGVILSPSYKIHHATWTELQIKVFGNNAAVILDRLQGASTLHGKTFTDDNRCSRLCLRGNGAWQIAFEQTSAIAPKGLIRFPTFRAGSWAGHDAPKP